MKSRDFYSNCVPSRIENIGIVVNGLLHCLQDGYGDLNENTLFELKVVLNEVMINAVRHGNGEDESKSVKVDARVSQRGVISIVVEDEGCGYDFDDTCNLRKPCCERSEPLEMSEGGRGIMIVRSLCDTVKVNAKGNKIVIVKRIMKV